MTPPKSGLAQQPRRGTRLPKAKVARFREKCSEHGHIGAQLCHGWLWSAAARARAGLPLPPRGTEPAGPDRDGALQWSQSEREYQLWSWEIEHAGSSIRDVLGQFLDLYDEADGDLLAISTHAWHETLAALPAQEDGEPPGGDPGAAQSQYGGPLPLAG